MSYLSRRVVALLAGAVCLTLGVRSVVALKPEEVAVIYNSAIENDESLNLAKYYMKARNIPENNLIGINYLTRRGQSEDEYLRVREIVQEVEYRKNLASQIRKVLKERQLLDGPKAVKCLVTVYGVPLKISGLQLDTESQNMLTFCRDEMEKTLVALEDQIEAYDQIVPPPPPPPPPSPPETAPATTEPAPQAATAPASQPATQAATRPARRGNWWSVVRNVETASNNARKRVEQLPADQQTDAVAELLRVHLKTVGAGGVLRNAPALGEGASEEVRAERAKIEAAVRAGDARMAELVGQLDTLVAKREMLAVRSQHYGLVGRAEQLNQFIGLWTETHACFDNELALALAEDQNYIRGRWVDNPRNVAVRMNRRGNRRAEEGVPRTIMVCRIDGQTVEKAQEMIDRTLEIEKKGLEGKMYLDARGKQYPDPYSSLDIQLRRLNEWMKTHSTMECVLDDKPAMFKAEDCPDAALYCGWYSLSNYVDVCQWVPGAVGYHVASGEMGSLHKRENKQWVVNLLNRGFCGTMGPTSEPYLSAFPNPAHFFPLLLCGEFTQGEVWEVTAPMLSWQVGFVGDPLYNPFKANPKVDVEVIKKDPVLRNAYLMLRPDVKLP
ncbi:MAG: TIGR03790 family protein [Phycisphaerales bacterium]|nr:TIGR03790 family protein [Phycisphaerales bacterium]